MWLPWQQVYVLPGICASPSEVTEANPGSCAHSSSLEKNETCPANTNSLTDTHSYMLTEKSSQSRDSCLFFRQQQTFVNDTHTHTTRYKFLVSQDTPTVFVKQHVSWTEHTVMMQHCCRKHATEQQARQKTGATIQRRLHWKFYVHIFTPKPSPRRLAGLSQWNHSLRLHHDNITKDIPALPAKRKQQTQMFYVVLFWHY